MQSSGADHATGCRVAAWRRPRVDPLARNQRLGYTGRQEASATVCSLSVPEARPGLDRNPHIISSSWPAAFMHRGLCATVCSKKQRLTATFLDPTGLTDEDAVALGEFYVKGIEFLSGPLAWPRRGP